MVKLNFRAFIVTKENRTKMRRDKGRLAGWVRSSIGGMFYSTFLSRNLISVSRNTLTPLM